MVHLLSQYRQRRDEAGTFARTLERELGALWTSVVEAGVEPANNRGERALRFAVLWRKMVQGTYNAKGDRWVERILSVRETCRLQGITTFPVLVEAVTCCFKGRHPDVSWIYPIRPPEQLRSGELEDANTVALGKTSGQIHNLHPSTCPPTGMFWTIEIPGHGIQVKLGKGVASTPQPRVQAGHRQGTTGIAEAQGCAS
jgi:hypothetical protein